MPFFSPDRYVPPRPLLILTLDGLATAALSCYGSSWNQTPAIDAIAASGAVWDRWTASSDDPHAVMQNWDQQGIEDDQGTGGWADVWRASGLVELITDVPELLSGQPNPSFDREETIDPTPIESEPATEIVDTQFGRLIAAAMDRDDEAEPWSLMWLHSDFLTRCWDAPRDLFPIDEIELTREPHSDAESLELEIENPKRFDKGRFDKGRFDEGQFDKGRFDEGQFDELPPIFPTVIPPNLQVDDSSHPDLVVAWMRTYGCQVRLVDFLVEVLLESISVDDPQIIVASTSGFRLGQGGWIGHRVGPLRSPDIRLPLIVSDQGPIRVPQLSSTDQLSNVLLALSQQDKIVSPEDWCQSTSTHVETSSPRAKRAITAPGWFCVEDLDESEHLFLKPDDVEDFNDVGRVRKDVVEELLRP